MADPKPLTRDQLAKFLPDQEAIRRFERLFAVSGDLTPTQVATLFRLVEEASMDAGIADSKAVSALDLLQRISDSLELVASGPANREDPFVKADYIDFPLSGPHVTQERRLQWNLDDGTLDMGLFNGVVLQVGQETMYYAKNTSGATIDDGQSVMATGSVGASGKLTIAKAVSDGSVPAHFMIGVATQSIAPNEFGYVTSFGLVRNINTTGAPYGETWADGDLLYFNPSIPGGLTNVQPEAPELKTPQAVVVVAGSGNGSIFVRMSVGMKLGDSDDVHATSPVAGNILIYDGTQNRWEAAHITAGTNVTVTNADGAITLSVSSAAPSGTAGGVLSGSYPDPGFAVDMATQAELDAHTGDTANPHATTAAQVGADPSGTAASSMSSHLADADPHPQYALESVVYSGTWTPTLTNVTNVDTSTPSACNFTRVGGVVVFSGTIQIDPTATGTTSVGVSLPIASNFTSVVHAAGAFNDAFNQSGRIQADATNDRLAFQFTANNTTNSTFTFSGSYRIL